MKSLKLIAVALATLIAAPFSEAAKIRFAGEATYKLGNKVKFYSQGTRQTGRRSNFGPDYYHTSSIGMRQVSNLSSSKSGNLSFEFWAMPYYGASNGIILQTAGLSPIKAGGYISKLRRDGHALFINRSRFPDLNIWERTGNGWKFRDSITYSWKEIGRASCRERV